MEIPHEEKVFFKDSNVIVTQSRFIAGGKTYAMRNISSVYTYKVKKSRTGAVICIVIGVLLVFSQSSRIFGILLALLGITWYSQIKDDYSVRISSNSGEADGIVSKDRIYIEKIVGAINDAIVEG